jgi:hypothetical protein
VVGCLFIPSVPRAWTMFARIRRLSGLCLLVYAHLIEETLF